MKYDLTLAKLRNTDFHILYERFLVGKSLTPMQYECLLSVAVCFTNATDEKVRQLGYRIIVSYCNKTEDYAPLYEISINNGLYPISKFIEQHYLPDNRRSFFTEWNNAFLEQYSVDHIYQSEQQHQLADFFNEKTSQTISISAPTSYGKSELILSAVKQYSGKKICVLTSTKALLIQTKKRLRAIINSPFSKIVIHPEMYNPNDSSCLAVLTQERLLRIFKKDATLAFDCIIVDEAHEILEDNDRSRTMANVIIVAQKRNPNVAFKFLTPFIADGSNLKTRYTSYDIEGYKVSEYIKTEKYYLYDLRNHGGLKLFDQFLNEFIPIPRAERYAFEEEFVKDYGAYKNIVYLNKPTDIENFALSLAAVLPETQSESISVACKNISSYLQPQYHLLTCLRKGIIYHHGSVPDAIRMYIEELYKTNSDIRYIITSSTLLSGVNLPAERMFILDNKRGRSNLSHDAFKNLVGRVCRFSEIFDQGNGSLKRLEPQIYLVFGKYFAQRANCESFLRNIAKVELTYKDDVENVLLERTSIVSSNQDDLRQASEFIENYENGIISSYQERYTQTEVGKSCIMNGISELDVFSHEKKMQKATEALIESDTKINNTDHLLRVMYDLFIQYLPEDSDDLKRLAHEEARRFYSMMLEWRMQNKSYSEMIGLFLSYWHHLLQNKRDVLIYVGKWGDYKYPGSNVAHYTKLANKNRTQIVNLAIVRIKEEQDFIDNVLIKFIEVLNDLSLLDNTFYLQVKYGTADKTAICLLQNGLSLSAATVLLKNYRSHLQINVMEGTVLFDDSLISDMQQARESQIMIYEVQSCM